MSQILMRVAQANDVSSYKIHGEIDVPNDLLPILLAETPLDSFRPICFAHEPSIGFGGGDDSGAMLGDQSSE